ncbi:MAG: hypothetical protein EB060_06300 [Proteobacteria bacterium]|nr:hypothetical protein [Pseudomonadota bacterium]
MTVPCKFGFFLVHWRVSWGRKSRMDIIERVRLLQVLRFAPLPGVKPHERTALYDRLLSDPPVPSPRMLYIGCVEARLEPNRHIGIPEGAAIIHRTMGAVVAGIDEKGKALRLGEAASVQLAVNVKNVQHIVVSAHTQCGGLNACLYGCDTPDMGYMDEYLKPFYPLRDKIRKHPKKVQMQELEEGTVRESLENLRTYPFVKAAEKKGLITLHGWVLDIDTKQISEVDQKTGTFQEMDVKYSALASRYLGKRRKR